MKHSAKRGAFDSNSVAELAIAFVIYSAGILISVFAVGAFLWFTLSDRLNAPEHHQRFFFLSVWALWGVLSLGMWFGIYRRIKHTPDIDLSENGFFKFQIASVLFVVLFWFLLRMLTNDFPEFITALRTLFEVLLAMFTVVYLSFAWTAHKKVPAKIYFGFALNIAALFAGRLM